MMPTYPIRVRATVLAAGLALLTTDHLRAQATSPLYDQLDRNRDGVLMPGELTPQVFALMDANKDGRVTRQEFAAAQNGNKQRPAPNPEKERERVSPDRVLSQVDRNRDGTITPDELPDQATFKELDANGDGKIAASELRAAAAPRVGAAAAGNDPRQAAAAAARHLDKNGDGRVDATDLPQKVWRRLSAFDANGDGVLQSKELESAAQPRLPVNKKVGAPNDKASDSPQPPSGSRILGTADRNGDGVVTPEELPPEVFKALDRDGDRRVTLGELNAAVAQRPKLVASPAGPLQQVQRHLDKNGDGSVDRRDLPPEVWRRLTRYDDNSDGVLSEREMRSLTDPKTGTRQGKPAVPSPQELLSKLDRNDDGRITSDEVPDKEVFRALNAGGAGFVTVTDLQKASAELERASKMVPQQPIRPIEPKSQPKVPAEVLQAFRQLDRDQSGRITLQELPQARIFARYDTNGDKGITLAEFHAGFPGAKRPEEPVRPKEPVVHKAGNLREQAVAQVRTLFAQWDKDKNEVVTRNELPGALFGQYDTNEDGRITLEELTELVLQRLGRGGGAREPRPAPQPRNPNPNKPADPRERALAVR